MKLQKVSGLLIKNITVVLLALFVMNAHASAATVTIQGGDALRLSKILQKFSTPVMNGTIKTLTAHTEANALNIVCTSETVSGREHDFSCVVTLSDLYRDDAELKVTAAKKFSNVIGVTVLSGKFQATLEKGLSIVPYQSVKTNSLLTYGGEDVGASYPALKISCNAFEKTCDWIMTFGS